MFPTVMELSGRKDCTVAEMGSWDDSGWVWDWSWTSEAAALDPEAVAYLTEMFLGIQLQHFILDKVIWLPDTIRGFTVKSCYEWVTNYSCGIGFLQVNPMVAACGSIWKNDIPSKVLVFSWRLLMNKLPTRENLHRRGILSSPYELSCVFCFQDVESATHIFCVCPFARSVWHAIFLWLNLDGALEHELLPSFHQVAGCVKGKKASRIKHLFWIASVWQLWLARNRIMFKALPWILIWKIFQSYSLVLHLF